MVSFYQEKPKAKKSAPSVIRLTIDDWDALGQGVCRQHAPVVIVEGALPGETCDVLIQQRKKNVWLGKVNKVHQAHDQRVKPFCPLYEQCGGCQSQHLDASTAITLRQQALDSQLSRQLAIQDIPWQAALTSPHPSYRRKARLAIDARNGNKIKIGFRSHNPKQIIDVNHCPVLVDELNHFLPELTKVIKSVKASRKIGHINLLAADNGQVVNLRVNGSISQSDRQVFIAFAEKYQLNFTLTDNDHRMETLYQAIPELCCETENGLSIQPTANSFIQVNKEVNKAMISQAMSWLAITPGDTVVDWFSGLGNFSLSMASRGANVLAVEGVEEMCKNAQDNALKQGIDAIKWCHADLQNPKDIDNSLVGKPNKVLLDPSREGAFIACQQLAQQPLDAVLYVSCNPASFLRDAQQLLQGGYQIAKIGLMEMFPYTHHVELMALFISPDNNLS
jgi:23S rRNA (uracil1939-C5)-methyltransferase